MDGSMTLSAIPLQLRAEEDDKLEVEDLRSILVEEHLI